MIRKRHATSQPIMLIAILSVGTLAQVHAQGFRNPPEGARAIGAFGGYMTFAEDAHTVIHNPANLMDVEQQTFQLNMLLGYGRNTFNREGIAQQKTRSPAFAIPGISAAIPIDERFAMGFAIHVPYGRSVEWERDGYFASRGLPYAGSMTVIDAAPVLAVRLHQNLSAAVGLNFYNGVVEQDTLIFGQETVGIPDGTRSRLDADGRAVGWNAAITVQLPHQQRVAASIRSPFSINFEGDNELEFGISSSASARIQYPTIVRIGYGIALTDQLLAEINAEWLEFSRYETLTIRDQLFGTEESPVQQQDTWTAGIGLQWNFHPQWTARAGYKYLENPTPDETYTPLTPDEDQGVISAGIGYSQERHYFDVGYAYGIFSGREIPDTNPAGGKHDYNVHLVSLSYGFRL